MRIMRFYEIFTMGLELNSKYHLGSTILAGKYGRPSELSHFFFLQSKNNWNFVIFILTLKQDFNFSEICGMKWLTKV